MSHKPDHTTILSPLPARPQQFGSFRLIAIVSMVTALLGCASTTLSDTDALAKSAAALGYEPDELILVKSSTIGHDTYLNLKTKKNHKEFTCIINHGGVAPWSKGNPPSCAPKGSAINTNPFQK
jgi:hypothetical protein